MNWKTFIGAATLLTVANASQVFAADLEVQITALKNTEGSVRICLWNKPEGFPVDETKAVETKVVKVTGAELTVRFNGLSNGVYAVSTIHDENDNGKLDMNLLGVPREGCAVSNNVPHGLAAPKFDKARLNLNRPKQTVKIKMLY